MPIFRIYVNICKLIKTIKQLFKRDILYICVRTAKDLFLKEIFKRDY